MSSFTFASSVTHRIIMYAIVKTGGKQFRAEKDGVIIVEKLEGEPGSKVSLGEVLMIVDGSTTKIGAPFVKGAKVAGEIVRQGKAKKINAFNYKAKKNERKRWGHRQPQTYIRETDIETGS